MQAMEPPLRNAPLIFITSKTTRVDLEPRPARGGQLVLHLAMMECHTWHGIGGRSGRVRRPRRLTRQIPLALDAVPSSSVDDCRRFIGRKIKDSLREEEEEYCCLAPAHWDDIVPGVAARRIVERARRDGGGGACEWERRVDISVRVEFVYSEAEALLLACVGNSGGGGPAGRRGNGAGEGDARLCSICFEEMSREAGEVADLPGCTHGFHRGCIAAWFQKASTCPICRRDQLQYLPPDYRRLHDAMTTDPCS